MNLNRIGHLFAILRSRRQVAYLPLDQKTEVFEQVRGRYKAHLWHEFACDLRVLDQLLRAAGAEAELVWNQSQSKDEAVEALKLAYPGLDERFCDQLIGEALFATR